MATRFYFPDSQAAPVTPPAAGAEWEHVNAQTRALLTVADSSALANTAYTPDGADDLTDKDALHRQYVSAALAAQTIGVQGITAQFQCFEANAANNLFLTFVIKVISNDGTTVQATILAITRDTSTELTTTTATNRNFPSVNTSSFACAAGDRILVEVGVGGLCAAAGGTQGHNATIRWGCSASSGDLPADDTETGTTFRPWLEFANTLTFSAVTYPQLERDRRGMMRGMLIGGD